MMKKKTLYYSKLLKEEYKDIEILAIQGAFSIVLKGFNLKLKRIEAIKCIDKEQITAAGLKLQSVENEIEIMSKLNHKNIVKVHNIMTKSTEFADYIFIIMEYCDSTISKIIKDCKEKKEIIPKVQVYLYLTQIVKGVAYLHENKIIHRDLKPDNIFIQEGKIKIGDFNISKTLNTATVSLATKPSSMFGTLNYSPPESISGMKGNEKLDSWCIGCVFYELLEGRMAFEGETDQEIKGKILNLKYTKSKNADQQDSNILAMTLAMQKDRITVIQLRELLLQIKGRKVESPNPGKGLQILDNYHLPLDPMHKQLNMASIVEAQHAEAITSDPFQASGHPYLLSKKIEKIDRTGGTLPVFEGIHIQGGDSGYNVNYIYIYIYIL